MGVEREALSYRSGDTLALSRATHLTAEELFIAIGLRSALVFTLHDCNSGVVAPILAERGKRPLADGAGLS